MFKKFIFSEDDSVKDELMKLIKNIYNNDPPTELKEPLEEAAILLEKGKAVSYVSPKISGAIRLYSQNEKLSPELLELYKFTNAKSNMYQGFADWIMNILKRS